MLVGQGWVARDGHTRMNVHGIEYPLLCSSRRKYVIMLATVSEETSCALRVRWKGRKG